MKEVLLIQSKKKWYYYPLLLLAIFCLISIPRLFKELFGTAKFKLLCSSLMIIQFAVMTLWRTRNVKVYNDKIKVKYLFHWKWNYQVELKDVSCCCAELIDGDYYRIYLLTGRKLWLYLCAKETSNFQEMLSLLTKTYGIPMREGSITLSDEELWTVSHGGFIELEDISEEELANMEAQRLNRPIQNKEIKLTIKSKIKYFLIEYWLFVVIALLMTISMSFNSIVAWLKNNNKAVISHLETNTEVSFKLFNEIHQIEVDTTNATIISQETRRDYKWNKTYKYYLWAFRVRERNDIWIFLNTPNYEEIILPDNYLRDFCITQLQQEHTYRLIDNTEEANTLRTLVPYSKNINIPRDAHMLMLEDKKLPKPSSYSYMQAITHKNSFSVHDFAMLKEAAEDNIAIAQYKLALKCDSGIGTSQNFEEAERWYLKAVNQDYDLKTKKDALHQLSYHYARKKQFDKANETINRAISLGIKDANLYNSKGEHLFRAGKKQDALKMWQKVISLDSRFQEEHNSELYKLLKDAKLLP